MTVLSDVSLPQINVLGSTMAYLSTREPNLVVRMAECPSTGCSGGALHRAGSYRVRPIGQT